ncbi:hypothetical protein E2C01_060611 [Portunus trituberculatus]|uniref:Uncharacterized protein n=1 Tax=Portunus trituberculatus TaxID=210409 RepID=A0A5B7H8K5_PORTR|nr:hypothetical protein [Portunus trituberculatus]
MKTVIFLLIQKKVKIPVVILIVIWETETNPHSDVHKPPHVAYSPPAMRWCVSPMVASTGLCFVGQVTVNPIANKSCHIPVIIKIHNTCNMWFLFLFLFCTSFHISEFTFS